MKVIVFEWCFEGWMGRTVKIKFIFPLFAYLFFSFCLAVKSLSQCLREPMFDLPLCILCKPRVLEGQENAVCFFLHCHPILSTSFYI